MGIGECMEGSALEEEIQRMKGYWSLKMVVCGTQFMDDKNKPIT